MASVAVACMTLMRSILPRTNQESPRKKKKNKNMKIIQVSRSYERKVSDGNFGSIGQFCSMTVDLDEGENEQEVSRALFETCKREVDRSMGTAEAESLESPKNGAVKPKLNKNGSMTSPYARFRTEIPGQFETPGTVDAVVGNGAEKEIRN